MPLNVLIFVIVLAAAYFVLVMVPRKRARVAQAELLAGLEEGEEVLTAGGLIGTIAALDDDFVDLRIADGVVVRLDRRAVAGRVLTDNDGNETSNHPETTDESPEALNDEIS
jgi:preprotein translocase subunit YajC